jgi:hypothetical protein
MSWEVTINAITSKFSIETIIKVKKSKLEYRIRNRIVKNSRKKFRECQYLIG